MYKTDSWEIVIPSEIESARTFTAGDIKLVEGKAVNYDSKFRTYSEKKWDD